MNQNFELPEGARSQLTDERRLPEGALELIELIMGELIEVASGVGRDYDEDEGDDPNLAGLVCSGRTRNRVAQRIHAGDVNKDHEIEALGSGLSTLLRGGGTEVHPYSCGNSETPLLAGSETKKRVLKETCEQLAFFSEEDEVGRPIHVVVAYSRDLQGVTSAKVGPMSGREEFAWEVPIYARPEEIDDLPSSGHDEISLVRPSHDQQHVDEPAVKLRPQQDKRENQ